MWLYIVKAYVCLHPFANIIDFEIVFPHKKILLILAQYTIVQYHSVVERIN